MRKGLLRVTRSAATQGIAAAALAVAEVSFHSPPDGLALLAAAGLGLAAGIAVGLAVGVVIVLLGEAPRVARWAFGACGAVGAFILADYMGILAALSGHAHRLGVVALAVTMLGSAVVISVVLGFVRAPDAPEGWLEKSSSLATTSALALMGLGAVLVGHRVVPPYYRAVENVSVAAGSLFLGFALASALRHRTWSSRVRLGFGVVALVLVVAPVIALKGDQDAAIESLDAGVASRIGLGLERWLTDVDRDGYSSLLGEGDCAPWDPRAHPEAREIPGNGVDDNCLFGDARVRVRPALATTVDEPSPLSVVLLTIDTLRADRMGLYGRRPSITPSFDAWATTGRIFDRAYTASTRTCSSLPTFQYGAYPLELEWAPAEGSDAFTSIRARVPTAVLNPAWMCVAKQSNAQGLRPLAAILRARGMATAAVVDDSFTFTLQREFFGEGFDRYIDASHLADDGVVGTALEVLDGMSRGRRPFFLWVHLFGPHQRGSSLGVANAACDYDAALARTDAAAKPLLDALDGVARRLPVAVIVASDHGERLDGSHRGHGSDLDDAVLRIPLVLRAPGVPPGRSDALVGSVDVVPTVLALTATSPTTPLVGTDISRKDLHTEGRLLVSDVWNERLGFAFSAVYDGRNKVTYNHRLRAYELSSQAAPAASPADPGGRLRVALDTYLHDTEASFSDYFSDFR